MITIDPLPPAPGPDRPTTLDADTQAFLNALQVFQAQLNAFGADVPLSVAAAMNPGAFSIPYVWKASTSGDPGAGGLGVDHATQTSATAILADPIDGVGINQASVIDQMDDSTNPVKGYARIVKVGDATKWLFFAGGAVSSPTGYKSIAVSSGVGSSASPFVDGDLVLLTFTPSGNVGPQGIQGPTALWTTFGTSVISGSPTLVTFTQADILNYTSLMFVFDGVVNPNAGLSIEVRRSGATWSTAAAPIHATNLGRSGCVIIEGRGLDIQTVVTRMMGSSPSDRFFYGSTDTKLITRNNGGVDGVRFSLAGANPFTSGTVIGLGK